MTIYNIFISKMDELGGPVSDCVYADTVRPELDSFIRELSAYKYGSADLLVTLQAYDNEIHAPAEILEQRWFHELRQEGARA